MTRITSATPSGYATTITFPRVANFMYPGDALTVTATKSGGGATTASGWEVYDFDGDLIASGSWSGSSGTIGTAGSGEFATYGWYRFKLTGTDAGDSAFTTDYGTVPFVIGEVCDDLPTMALRTDNPSYQTDGQDAPYIHGPLSLGGFRVTMPATNIQPNRLQNHTTASAATSISTSLSAITTVHSNVILVHVVVGDSTGMAGPAGFTEDYSDTTGSGSTKVTLKVYRKYGQYAGGTTWTCTTTNSADHSLYVSEVGPHLQDAAPIAVLASPVNGTGSSVVIDFDFTSLGNEQEYALITGVGVSSGGYSDQVSTPAQLSTAFAFSNVMSTHDSAGGGIDGSITYTLTGSANYVGFVVAYGAHASVTYSTNLAGAQSQITARYQSWGQYEDPNRPYRQITVAINLTSTTNAVELYARTITQVVADLQDQQPGFIACFTGRNEPGSSFSVVEAQNFKTAVVAGAADAKAGGPGMVTMGFNAAALAAWKTLADAGMFDTDALDIDTFHNYNHVSGGVADLLAILRAYKAARDARDLTNDLYMTEGSHDTTWIPGLLRVRQAGTTYMLQTLAQEVILGMPYEHQFWYYDRRSGFDSVTTWQSSDGGLLPGYAMHRPYAIRLIGKTLDHAVSFGDHYDDICVGGVFRNPDDDTASLAVAGCEGMPEFTFALSGSHIPTTLTGRDCWGNTSTVTVTGRTFTLTPSELIQYVELPAGVDCYARPVANGVNFLTVPVVTITDDGDGSATVTRMNRLIDGDLLSPYAYTQSDLSGFGSVYLTANNTFPRNIDLVPAFGATVTVDTIALYCPSAWQAMAPPLKGKLQYTTDGSTWLDPPTTAAQPNGGSWDNTSTVTVKNYDLYNDTLADAYTEPQHYFEFSLGGQQTIKGVRVVITTACRGMWLDSTMENPEGNTITIDDTNATVSSSLIEVFAYNAAANVPLPAMTA